MPVCKLTTTGLFQRDNKKFPQSDLTGSQDGSVLMWEWGHMQPVATPRPPGTFAKVTRVRFSQHGNKFGVADGDGNVSLWQVGMASSVTRPFFVSFFFFKLQHVNECLILFPELPVSQQACQ
jgi:WD40 repeat protein